MQPSPENSSIAMYSKLRTALSEVGVVEMNPLSEGCCVGAKRTMRIALLYGAMLAVRGVMVNGLLPLLRAFT